MYHRKNQNKIITFDKQYMPSSDEERRTIVELTDYSKKIGVCAAINLYTTI